MRTHVGRTLFTLLVTIMAVWFMASSAQAWHEHDGTWHTFNMEMRGSTAEPAQFAGGVTDLVVRGNYAYLGSLVSDQGLFILDITLPTLPSLVGQLPISDARVNGLAVNEAGTLAVLTNEPNTFGDDADLDEHFLGLTLVDISDKRDPHVIKRLPITNDGQPEGIHRVALHDEHVYLAPGHADAADSPAGLIVIDVSNPHFPSEVARVALPSPDDLDFPDGSQAVDVSLHDVSVHELPSGRDIAVLSAWDAGVLIYDVTVPSDPILVGKWRNARPAFLNVHGAQISPDGELLVFGPEYGRGYAGFLTFLDITQLNDPKLITTWSRPGPQWQTAEQGEPFTRTFHFFDFSPDGRRLYVAGYGSGVWALDVQDPSHPRIIGSFGPESFHDDIPEQSQGLISAIPMVWDVVVQDGVVYVSDFNSGFYALELIDDAPWGTSE